MFDGQRALEKKTRIEQQVQEIDKKLNQLPSKRIFCTKDGNAYKWYESNGKKNKYLSKKRRAYAERLAIKKYLTLLRADLMKEKTALDFYLRHHSSMDGKANQLLMNEAYSELLSNYFRPKSEELYEWMNSPYEKAETYSENLIHKTNAGILVRSKSEAMIVTELYVKKIPFRYECCLKFAHHCYYPDFTIRHPQNGDFFYWEHFGMMDDFDYRKKAFEKLSKYAEQGLIVGVNLIATFESRQHPLELAQVQNLIQFYFL